MDSFRFNLQAEKANVILKHRKLRRIASLFRVIEVCVVLILISRLSLKLPVAVRNSSEYLKEFSLFMNSPRFVFLIGNVIVITLFAQFSGRKDEEDQEIVLHNRKSGGGNSNFKEEDQKIKTESVKMKVGGADSKKKKGYVYRRCETEVLKKRRRVLRRCESENKRKSVEFESDGPPVVEEEGAYPEDEMSSEEFRRTVEAFIARQQKVRKEEGYYLH